MTQYIQTLVLILKALKSGLGINAAQWLGQPVTEIALGGAITDLEKQEEKIELAMNALQQERAKGRQLYLKHLALANQTENLALGIHAAEPEKLTDYDIKLKKPGAAKPVPGKAVVKNIADDDDGEGFILEREAVDDAANYEWQKAAGDSPSVTNIDEGKFSHFKTTKKVKFVDDDVKRGVRYFYRVRAFNATGNGAWSEPVSRVQ